jgi:ribosome-binding protein aMBF1 (putative translation factor)
MKDNEYNVARETLGWTHEQLGDAIGVSPRCPYRYANGETIPEPVRKLLRLLIMLRLTMSGRKFNEIVKQLQ